MNVLVTVGTTPFPSLINMINQLNPVKVEFFVQHAEPNRMGMVHKNKAYVDNIKSEYKSFDVIITHAGAGSVYSLLEAGCKIIVVPNLERKDPHQREIGKFVEDGQYGLVAWDVFSIENLLSKALVFKPKPYRKDIFFKINEIKKIINWHV